MKYQVAAGFLLLALVCQLCSAHNIVFNGSLRSCNGPVAGVTVTISGCTSDDVQTGTPTSAVTDASGNWQITMVCVCCGNAAKNCVFTVDNTTLPAGYTAQVLSTTVVNPQTWVNNTYQCLATCNNDPSNGGCPWLSTYDSSVSLQVTAATCPQATVVEDTCTPTQLVGLGSCPERAQVRSTNFKVACVNGKATVTFTNSLYKFDCSPLSWVGLAVRPTTGISTTCTKTNNVAPGQQVSLSDVPCGSTVDVYAHDGSYKSTTSPLSQSADSMAKMLKKGCYAGNSNFNCGPYGAFVVQCPAGCITSRKLL